MIDQRKLPLELTHIDSTSPEEVAGAIRDMVVRGAPAIGVAAAFGFALGATQAVELSAERFNARLEEAARVLCDARPTAINLAWAVRQLQATVRDARAAGKDNPAIAELLEEQAQRICDEDVASCRMIGR